MHRLAGANCTDAKLYLWTIFQFVFDPNGTWAHPPTSKLFLDFWNFFNFAKPLNLRVSSVVSPQAGNRRQVLPIGLTHRSDPWVKLTSCTYARFIP